MQPDRETEWALWRFSVLGPLVSSRLEHGDRLDYLREAAKRLHVNPDGVAVRIPLRTLEAWYYAWKKDGLAALKRDIRSDRGKTLIPEHLQERLTALKRENPRRSIRRLIRMLERSGEAKKGELSRSSVQRFLSGLGLSGRHGGGEPVERRSFRHEEPGDLWMGDVLHGPLVIAGGRIRKSYVIAFIDSATRFVPAAEVRLSESAPDHEYALKQAILKHGPPRALYLDNGAAQSSLSLKLILAELSIRLIHTQAYDPEAKGAIERWNRTFRDEVESELPQDPLALEEFQSRVWAWLSVEYNARVHTTTGRIPREDWLRDPSLLRTLPRDVDLDEVFLHRERRVVRRDGTVRFRGIFLEVRTSLVGNEVELRFDPFAKDALPRVYLEGKFVCDTTRLDPIKNSTRKRHRSKGTPQERRRPASTLYGSCRRSNSGAARHRRLTTTMTTRRRNSAMYKQRFGLTGMPFPKNAYGKTFYDELEGYKRLESSFEMLKEEPGVGLLTAEPGVGKTASIRNLALALPRPEFRVLYLCDTTIGAVDVYRGLALELGLKPAFRRGALWRDLKERIVHMVDEHNEQPLLILDEAHHLSDRFLADYSGFLNFAFDSRDLFTTWFVGQPQLRARLKLQVHAALRTRIVTSVHLESLASREIFTAFLEHGLGAVGAKGSLIADSARELLFRASGGLPREVGKLVRKALRLAHERAENFIDEDVVEAAIRERVET